MTSRGPARRVERQYGLGRLANARAFRRQAENALALAERGDNANPIIASIVDAAIAYGDAVGALVGGRVNQQDHAGAPQLLRAILGHRLPGDQERRFRRLLGNRDDARYGARAGRLQTAEALLEDLQLFAAWVDLVVGG